MGRLKKLMAGLHRDESGAMSVEKILILALVSIPLVLVLLYFMNSKLIPWFNGQADQLKDPGTTGGGG